MVTVTLKQQQGVTDTPLGRQTVTLPQSQVYADAGSGPKFVGYLPDGPESKFLPVPQFVECPDALQSQILDALDVAAGRKVECGIKPLTRAQVESMAAAAGVYEEIEDEGEGDE